LGVVVSSLVPNCLKTAVENKRGRGKQRNQAYFNIMSRKKPGMFVLQIERPGNKWSSEV
jgi:hypothetical protein